MTLVAGEMEEGRKYVEAAKFGGDLKSQSMLLGRDWIEREFIAAFLGNSQQRLFWQKALLNKNVFIIYLLVMSERH